MPGTSDSQPRSTCQGLHAKHPTNARYQEAETATSALFFQQTQRSTIRCPGQNSLYKGGWSPHLNPHQLLPIFHTSDIYFTQSPTSDPLLATPSNSFLQQTMDPPMPTRAPWERNLKAREYTAAEWEQHHETFKELYFIRDLSLAEARQVLAEQHNFYAT